MIEKYKFKVTINNAGEILTMYTTATNPQSAIRNAIYQLANKLWRNSGAQDNWHRLGNRVLEANSI